MRQNIIVVESLSEDVHLMEAMKEMIITGRTRAKRVSKAFPETQLHTQASVVSAKALTGIYRVALSSWARLLLIQSGW